MNSNIKNAQLQIKSFNKYLSRHIPDVSDSKYEVITDLIGENITGSGYGKAGTKFLESMSNEELLSYLSDLEAAKRFIIMDEDVSTFIKTQFYEEDIQAGIWRMYQYLEDKGHNFDSEQAKAIADGDVGGDYGQTLIEMGRLITDENYGVSDFTEYFNSLPKLK